MRLGWALLLGVVAGVAAAWWLERESPERTRLKMARADTAAAANAEDARPVLYRWRDRAGLLHVTAQPPKGRHYERIEPTSAIEVDGARQ